MLDGIPFGSAGGIVGDGHSQGKGVRQLGLEFGFPGMTAATVATAGISQNEQLAGTGIASGTFLVPPMSDGMSGKGGSVMGNANDEGTAIFHNIVNPIRNGDPHGIGAEVVIIDATRGRFPTTARIFEIADELAFLAVDADDGQMTALETVAQLGQIFELKISVGTRTGGDLLMIDAQRIAHVMEQAGDGIGGDGNAEFSQLFGDGGSSTARPA